MRYLHLHRDGEQVTDEPIRLADGDTLRTPSDVTTSDADPPDNPAPARAVTVEDRLATLEADVKGIRDRAAAVTDPDARKVRDAVVG